MNLAEGYLNPKLQDDKHVKHSSLSLGGENVCVSEFERKDIIISHTIATEPHVGFTFQNIILENKLKTSRNSQ